MAYLKYDQLYVEGSSVIAIMVEKPYCFRRLKGNWAVVKHLQANTCLCSNIYDLQWLVGISWNNIVAKYSRHVVITSAIPGSIEPWTMPCEASLFRPKSLDYCTLVVSGFLTSGNSFVVPEQWKLMTEKIIDSGYVPKKRKALSYNARDYPILLVLE